MRDGLAKTGIAGAAAALGLSACCVLPMVMILLGLGGSWLVVFANLAALALPVSVAVLLVLGVGWVSALRHGAPRRTYRLLAAGTALSAAAWTVFLAEGRINDILMTLM